MDEKELAFDIEQDITEQERNQAMEQALAIIRSRYLQYKTEYISAKVNKNKAQMDQMLRLMKEADASYRAVKGGL